MPVEPVASHRSILGELHGLNEHGKGRVVAALHHADTRNERCLRESELPVVDRFLVNDQSLDGRGDRLIRDKIAIAFAKLASPETATDGVPHQLILDNLHGLNEHGKGRVAAALRRADETGDMRLRESELPVVDGFLVNDQSLDGRGDRLIRNKIAIAFAKLASPETAQDGVPHETLLANLSGLNEHGRGRAAAALRHADASGDMRLRESELPVVDRFLVDDQSLDGRGDRLIRNKIHTAFCLLAPPTPGAGGVCTG